MTRTAHRTPTRNHPQKRPHAVSSSSKDNRLHTVADDRSYSYYAYDHTGQRTLKMAGNASLIDQNAWYQSLFVGLNRVTMYPSAYLVLSEHGYTKHYYAGAERVAARIGGGNLNHDTECIVDDGEAIERSNNLFWQCSDMVNSAVIEHRDLEEMNIVNIDNDEMEAMWKFDMKQVPSMMKAEVIPEPWKILDAIEYFSQPNSIVSQGDDDESDVYFYHSDHLGSASWITDGDGMPVQHLQYLPYGEPYINQRVSGYSERFRFTGKERDAETGYSYFGARYMDHELMTMWLSVDPLADKYPSISPYAYCAWNPVKLVDPDGRDIDPSCIKDWKEQRVSILDKRNKLATVREVVGGNISWGQQIRGFSGCCSLPWMSKMSELNERIESLDETLSMMGKLENDHSTTYTLSRTTGNGSVYLVTEGEKKGMVSIIFSNTSSFVHEVTHAGQYYNNDIGFFLNTGAIAAYDIYDEVNAYKAALAYSPYSYDNKRMFMHQVTPEWVRPRSDTYSGCGTISVNIFSPATQINSSGINNLGQYHDYLEIPSNLLMYRH